MWNWLDDPNNALKAFLWMFAFAALFGLSGISYLAFVVFPEQNHARYEAFKKLEPNTPLTEREYILLYHCGCSKHRH